MEAVTKPPSSNLVTVTGAAAPTSAKIFAGNVLMRVASNLLPFLAGGALVGVLMLAYLMPFMIEQAKDSLRAEFEAYIAPIKTDLNATKIDAKIAKEDALSALVKLEERNK